MNKEKLAALKQKLKKNAPHIVALGTSVAGIAATVYAIAVVNDCKTNTIRLTKEDREAMKSGNVDINYKIDGCDYTLTHSGPDHMD